VLEQIARAILQRKSDWRDVVVEFQFGCPCLLIMKLMTHIFTSAIFLLFDSDIFLGHFGVDKPRSR
jgi:hypothetical protein